MSRETNIEFGKASDKIIINELKKTFKCLEIFEVEDGQQNRDNLQGKPKLLNEINMRLGIDYVILMEINGKVDTHFIDTKGFKYSSKHNGTVNNGIVETILLQVSKEYGNKTFKGWANNPEHWTTHIIILLNGHIYIMNYKRLVQYCNRLMMQYDVKLERFEKENGSVEYCFKGNVKEMEQQKVVTLIKPVEGLNYIAFGQSLE